MPGPPWMSVVVLALACVIITTMGQEEFRIVPENLVEQIAPEEPRTVSITRECFEKSCMNGGGHKECRLNKMPCATQHAVPWSVFLDPDTHHQRLLASDEPATGGLVGLTVHKKPLNPNTAVKMPGVPKVAPPKLVAQLKKQDKLLNHIAKLESAMLKKHADHAGSRKSWLALEDRVLKMPAGPNKLKSENLLLKLAKEMSQEDMVKGATKADDEEADDEKANESDQPTAIVKKAMDSDGAKDDGIVAAIKKIPGGRAIVKKVLVAKMRAAAQAQEKADRGNPQAEARDHLADEMAPKFVKAMMAKIMPEARGEKSTKTIDGIPVGHRKCFERACISRDADGNCAAAVISCGDANGNKPKKMGRLSQKEALKAAQKDMGPMLKGLQDTAAHGSTLAQLQGLVHESEAQEDARDGFLSRLSKEDSI